MDVRVGNGFDVHAFCEGDHVWLCGVRIPHGRGLLGHSDADVLLHEVMHREAIEAVIAAEPNATRLREHPLIVDAHSWSKWSGPWYTVYITIIARANLNLDQSAPDLWRRVRGCAAPAAPTRASGGLFLTEGAFGGQ